MAIDWSKLIYANTSTPYLDSYKTMANDWNKQAETDRARMSQNEANDITQSNAGYDNTARQNYIWNLKPLNYGARRSRTFITCGLK